MSLYDTRGPYEDGATYPPEDMPGLPPPADRGWLLQIGLMFFLALALGFVILLVIS